MKEIDEELKVLTNIRIRTDICIDSEKKRVLLNILYESKKNSEQRLKVSATPGVIEALRYNIKKIDELSTDIRKIDECR